ncbi:MAG TPA: phosphopantothenate/pantothenate synthetase [Patescibacteria group bacterium]
MIDPHHPRAKSLQTREQLVEGVKMGITSLNGLISHGRGEAFDYLLSEHSHDFAIEAINAAAATLVLAKHPVLCTNGNSSALVAQEYVTLSRLLDCPIEINLFHRSKEREQKIKQHLESFGAKNVLGVGSDASDIVPGIASPRKMVSPQGISKADVVFIPLEDGDRTEAVVSLSKTVITVDLNPLSRTAKMANITIVDNIVRCMSLLIQKIEKYKNLSKEELEKIIAQYDNAKILLQAEKKIRQGTM